MTLCSMTTVNMANKFTDDHIGILINKLMWQSEPALWNSNLLIYNNADARKAALARISSQLNIDTGMWAEFSTTWMLNSDLSAMLSQHYVTYDVNVVTTSRLPERSFFWLTDKPRLLLFCFSVFVSHVNTLKQNWNKTISLKQNIVLRLFCFSFVSVLFQL